MDIKWWHILFSKFLIIISLTGVCSKFQGNSVIQGKSGKSLGRYSVSNFLPKFKKRPADFLARTGSLSEDEGVDSILDNQARLTRIRDQLFATFNDTYKSVREEVAIVNRDNMFLMVVNFIGGFCAMANVGGGELDFFALGTYTQMSVAAQALYGYGYSAPFSEFFERPVSCEFQDLKQIFDDYEFLDKPDPETDKKILTYYTTELNVDVKRKLFCISKKADSNQSAREFFGLLDLYTSIQQEVFSA